MVEISGILRDDAMILWIVARSAGAYTTPVYVKVDGRRFWKLRQVEALVATRMDQLRQVERLPDQQILLTGTI